MGAIPANQARGMFTQMLTAVFREETVATTFLTSLFTRKINKSRLVEIAVERGTEKVAVDVMRGSDGNRNTFSKQTLKIFESPYYREYFDATELDIYDRMFSSATIDDQLFASFITSVADKLRILKDKIVRAIEIQCSQVLQSGVVTVQDGLNIDYKRKSASLVNDTSNRWTTDTVNPYDPLAVGAGWLRTDGKMAGGRVNLIFGTAAWSAFINNPIVLKRNDIKNIKFDSINAPQRNSLGANVVGEIAIGDYMGTMWTYPQYYEDALGNDVPYIDPKNVIMTPENPRFDLVFSRVPQLITQQNPTPIDEEFVYGEYIDQERHAHKFDVRSAPLAIPTAVDQIWTAKVVA